MVYDENNGEIIWTGKQASYLAGRKAGAIDGGGYVMIGFLRKSYSAHRLAWFLHYGEWPSLHIDHIDGNKENNKINNLRLATHLQNQMNSGPRRRNKNGYKGITYQESHKSWLAQLTYKGKNYNLGRFKNPEDAARAYDARARELFGDFAWQNFP